MVWFKHLLNSESNSHTCMLRQHCSTVTWNVRSREVFQSVSVGKLHEENLPRHLRRRHLPEGNKRPSCRSWAEANEPSEERGAKGEISTARGLPGLSLSPFRHFIACHPKPSQLAYLVARLDGTLVFSLYPPITDIMLAYTYSPVQLSFLMFSRYTAFASQERLTSRPLCHARSQIGSLRDH